MYVGGGIAQPGCVHIAHLSLQMAGQEAPDQRPTAASTAEPEAAEAADETQLDLDLEMEPTG